MAGRLIAERFDVHLVRLHPTVGAEMRKTRPCVVVSPNSMHRNLFTVLIAPMTGTVTHFPSRIRSTFGGKSGEIALDQLRAVDISRIGRKLGRLPANATIELQEALVDLFT